MPEQRHCRIIQNTAPTRAAVTTIGQTVGFLGLGLRARDRMGSRCIRTTRCISLVAQGLRDRKTLRVNY